MADTRVEELERLLKESQEELSRVTRDLEAKDKQLQDSDLELKNTKEDMDSKLEQMEHIYKRQEELLHKFSTQDEKKTEVGTVYVSRERHVDKFSGQPSKDKYDAEQWCREVSRYLNTRVWLEPEKIDFILEHLHGPAREEINYRDVKNLKSNDILDILRTVFSEADTLATLKAKFYTASQTDEEDLLAFSLRLMKIMTKIEEKGSPIPDKDDSLKGQFTEGVKDEHLKRELRRLKDESPSLKFHEFRQCARDWLGPKADVAKCKPKGKETSIMEVTTNGNDDGQKADSTTTSEIQDKFAATLEMLVNQMQQLDRKVEEFTEQRERGGFRRGFGYRHNGNRGRNSSNQSQPETNNGSGRGTWNSRGRGRPFVPAGGNDRMSLCFLCNSSDHFVRNCPDNPNNKRAEPPKDEVKKDAGKQGNGSTSGWKPTVPRERGDSGNKNL